MDYAGAITNIMELVGKPNSIIDIGCGRGFWLQAFKECGVLDILGIDKKYDPEMSALEEKEFLSVDISEPFLIGRTFELVISLEVAEHLPADRADGFVADLSNLGDVILFGAAIPLQGGDSYINEQFPQYWIQKFKNHGFVVIDIRDRIKTYCSDCWWYAQNTLLFVKKDALRYYPELVDKVEEGPVFAYIHESLLKRMAPMFVELPAWCKKRGSGLLCLPWLNEKASGAGYLMTFYEKICGSCQHVVKAEEARE